MVTSTSIPFAIPSDLGVAASTIADSIYTDDGSGFDFALDGVPYISGVGAQSMMIRKTVMEERIRQDTQLEPGEHLMTAWWVKAQSSFHLGAGQKYLDSNDSITGYRFWQSRGVDVWTPGQVKLLKGTIQVATATATSRFCTTIFGGVNTAFLADGTTYKMYQEVRTVTGTDVALSFTPTTCTSTGVGSVLDVATDGTNYFVADTAGIWKGSFATPATTMVKIYNFVAAPVGVRLGWVKQRLMLAAWEATNGARVYELDSNASAGSVLPTQKFTHANRSWAFTGISEGPGAIYVSGYAGATSAIHKFVLDTSSGGTVPTLTTGITAVDMPVGEIVLGIAGYASSALGVVTNRGFRVGVFQNTSDVNLGGLTVKQTNTTGAVCGSDRFLYTVAVPSNTTGTLYRVDISQQTDKDQGVFAFAEDLRGGVGVVSQAAAWGDRIAFLVPSGGLYVQEESRWVSTGFLTSSRIRFDTLEKKRARLVRLRLDPENGHGTATIAVSAESTSAFTGVAAVQQAVSADSGDTPLYVKDAAWYGVQITLNREDVSTEKYSPIMSGYQLKVLPAAFTPTRSVVPLLCFDEEETRTGGSVFRPALARLRALESIQSSGRVVRFQVLAADPAHALSELVVVESVDYAQVSAPDDDTAFGGVLTVTVRSIG